MTRFTSKDGTDRQLRLDAEARLRSGTAPHSNGWEVSLDSLALLYRLASTPDSAGDALKLLHELQVYQVELDLQRGQLEANEDELVHALARYKAFYDFAPVGYLILGPDGQVNEANMAGAQLLGIKTGEAGSRHIDSILAPESRSTVAGLLSKLRAGGSVVSCDVHSKDTGSGSRLLRIIASISPGGEGILMVVGALDPSQRV